MPVKKITIEIVHPEFYKGFEEDLRSHIGHCLGAQRREIMVDFKIEEIEDPRTLPDPPEICKNCKWERGKECWWKGIYHGTDFNPCDDCFEPAPK